MTQSPDRVPVRVRRWRLLAAVAMTLVGVGCLFVWAAGQETPTATPGQEAPTATPGPETPTATPGSASPPAGTLHTSAAPGSPAAPPAPPTHLRIPDIGVSTELVRLGLQADRTVEVPGNPARAGWFHLGPSPGTRGSSVILGHVDSQAGPAVFHRLSNLDPGAPIVVRMADGSVTRFAVVSIATYPNDEFPAQRVYAATGARRLNLVTCGGVYDGARGGWQSNVVAYTRWVSTTPS